MRTNQQQKCFIHTHEKGLIVRSLCRTSRRKIHRKLPQNSKICNMRKVASEKKVTPNSKQNARARAE